MARVYSTTAQPCAKLRDRDETVFGMVALFNEGEKNVAEDRLYCKQSSAIQRANVLAQCITSALGEQWKPWDNNGFTGTYAEVKKGYVPVVKHNV